MHPTLRRLDELAAGLAADPAVLAVLGLGSAGAEHGRFDSHSDIDFWLVVSDGASKRRYLEQVEWLSGFGGRLAYSFANDPNGRKALLDDGLFLEYAVFTPPEVRRLPFSGARVVWQRPGAPFDPDDHPGPPAPTALDSVEFHVNEALTNLFVGLHRELRGERLTAFRFIQVYAVDRVLALLRLDPGRPWVQRDPFESTRRVETSFDDVPLGRMVPGYARNTAAAGATLEWLTNHFETDPVMVGAVRELLGAPSDGPSPDRPTRRPHEGQRPSHEEIGIGDSGTWSGP